MLLSDMESDGDILPVDKLLSDEEENQTSSDGANDEDDSIGNIRIEQTDDEPQHLSLFDDKDLVELLLQQDETSVPRIKVESVAASVENLDHVYSKQQPTTDSSIPRSITQQLMIPLDSSISVQSPISSSSSSSGYDSDPLEDSIMPWEESFNDLFPDLAFSG